VKEIYEQIEQQVSTLAAVADCIPESGSSSKHYAFAHWQSETYRRGPAPCKWSRLLQLYLFCECRY